MSLGKDSVALRRSYPELNPNPVFEASLDGEITYANPAATAIFGSFESYPWLSETVGHYREGKKENATLVAKVDASRWFQFTAFAVEEPPVIRFYGMDITDLKRAEEELQREKEALRNSEASLESQVRDRTRELEKSVRLYRMLSQCNQTLVAAVNEEELLRKICEIIVKDGGYSTSWVGYTEEGDSGAIRPIVSVGIGLPSLMNSGFSWADSSSPSFPLSEPGKPPFGALVVGSRREAEFDEAERQLFTELSNDLSFGILALRAHAERDTALRSLELSNRRLHRLSGELALAEQNERRQLAGVLHDEVQQILVGAKLRLECLEDENAKPCQDLLEDCLRITRSLTSELCPAVLYRGNIVAVLEWLTQWSREKYGLDIGLQTTAGQVRLSEDLTIMIYRSIQELLFNIAKHAKTLTGKIEVACSDDRVHIRVSDQGEGFDPSAVQSRSVEGGFGLFAVQERLQNRGCEFRIESSPGKGSAFTIAAPLAEEPKATLPAKDGERSRIKVLVVDDHAVIRQAMAAMLDLNDDIEVVGEAENGREALERARRLSPDIVLMDIEMPEIDGIKATRLLRLEHPQIKVIGLSMHDKRDVEAGFLEAGASSFLMKNAPSSELIRAIRTVCALG